MTFGPTAPHLRDVHVPRRFVAADDVCIYPRAWDRRASLRPLLTWALVIFLAGFIGGIFTSLALSALSSSITDPGGNRGRSGLLTQGNVSGDGSAVRAGRLVEARGVDARTTPQWVRADDASPSSAGPARTDTIAIITEAFAARGLDVDHAIAVAFCESSLDPSAVGDHGAAVGLWQWHLPSFLAHARQLYGRDIGDLRADPVVSSRVTAFTVAQQGWGIWTCGGTR